MMNGNGEDMKKRIMEALRERPVGLTIRDLSNAVGVHRQTVAKYVLVLEAEGLIHRRLVGSAALHYPKDVFLKNIKMKEVKRK